jgi:hypothetical protein
VVNHRLLGGGFLRGHIVYERSPVFLGVLTEGVCGRPLPLARTRKEKWIDWLLLAGETLLAPAGAAIVLIAGVAIFLMTAFLLPFLVSLPLRQFLPEPTWVRIENLSALAAIGFLVVTFLVAPLNRARKVHRLFWAGTARPVERT